MPRKVSFSLTWIIFVLFEEGIYIVGKKEERETEKERAKVKDISQRFVIYHNKDKMVIQKSNKLIFNKMTFAVNS